MADGSLPPEIANRDARKRSADDPIVASSVIGKRSESFYTHESKSISEALSTTGVRALSIRCPVCEAPITARGSGVQVHFDLHYNLCSHLFEEHDAETPEID